MLDLINRYANGFVAIPVIEACRRRGMFELLTGKQVRLEELVSKLGANEGHLRVALRLLLELGWLTKTGQQSYSVTSSAGLSKQLPKNIGSLLELEMTGALRDPDGTALRYWLDLCATGWDGTDPALAGLLDGVVLAPLLVGIHQLGGAEAIERQGNGADGITLAACEAIRAFFNSNGWNQAERDDFTLNEAGRYVVASGATLGTVVSYASMLRHIDDLLFGNSTAVFVRDAVGRESHVDRTLNVVSSGSQHQTYFAELEEVICSIFDQEPLDGQPHYVCDMGCGDGSLLRRIYHIILERAARGKALDRFPLGLIGVDFNQEALESTARTLAGLPHRLVQGDIGDPQRLMLELARIGISDTENVLHIRSFLDHDRRVVAPDDQAALARRANLAYTGVYVDAEGRFVQPETAVQSLVEHLSQWRSVVSAQGLIVLEVHCLRPETVLVAGNRTESLHFDAYHGFSGQQLVEAPVFLMAAAEAGLFPDRGTARRFPRTGSFTRISLNRLVPQPFRVRHPVPGDLNALQRLERECVPENLLTPSEELVRRLNLFPEGQAVLEYEEEIVAVLYSQRLTSVAELVKSNSANQARLHDREGRYVQLLGLYVHPEVFGQGLGDQFVDFMLLYFAACEGVNAVVGVTRCLDYWRHRQEGMTLSQYIGRRDDRGRLIEPMLNFHESHGASIRQIVSGFRPEDVRNDGAGVFIEYRIRNGSSERETKVAVGPERLAGDLAEIVQECALRILTPTRAAAYGPDVPFMAMGLKSMDLLELRYLLEEKIGKELGSTIFFRYGTPVALIAHLKGEPDSAREARAVAVRQTDQKEEGIAVIGIGCHFPGEGRGPDRFWTLLLSGSDAITEISSARRDILRSAGNEAAVAKASNLGGFVSDIDQFDAAFFRISAREARLMDPQQRLLLEIVWEAMEHAGLGPLNLRGSATGVFVGAMSRDYEALIAKRGAEHDFDTYFSTGNASSVAAGRLAYFFDWRGPAMTVDTACSSSLVALHLACRSLVAGECNLAVAAGVNLLLDPKSYAAFGRAGMLSADGRCKTFDAVADGYVRSEGCGAIVLKRVSEARRDGERILAVIRGSASNQDGASGGLTVPNQLSQQEVIEKALRVARIDPSEVAYLEAHGTGTSLGDPIEIQAAAAALGHGRASDRPLLVGSVKTNIGHLEAAAGIAGVIKVVLSLERGRIPRHLHFRNPNPHIPWDQLPVRIASETTPWPAGKRIASVSSFGFSGTNAHVVIEEAAADAKEGAFKSPPERSDHLLALSARDETALKHLAGCYLDWWSKHPDASGPDVGFTAGVGRSHLAERAALVFNSTDEARQLLAKLEKGEPAPRLFRGQISGDVKGAWLFPDEGSHYVGMGKELYETQPVVREILERCDQAIFDYGECRLLEAMFGRDECLQNSRYAYPASFALQAAMAGLWHSWGYAPEVVLGYGAGQYAAAQVAGALSLEDGLRLTHKRGELIDRLGSPDGFIIKLADSEQHPAIESLLEEFRAHARGVNFLTTKLPILCSLTGHILPAGSRLDASYWVKQLQEAPAFDRDIQKLADLKVNLLVELGRQPAGRTRVEQRWPDQTPEPAKIASLRPGVGENRQLAEAVAQLYSLGLTPDFGSWDRPWPRRKIALPTYPFQRARHWLDMDRPVASESKTNSWRVESASTESERVSPHIDRCLYELVWRPRELPPVSQLAQSDAWLILADKGGFANRVAGVLAKFGQKHRLVFSDEIINSTLLEALLEDLKKQEAPLMRVIDLLGLDLPNKITTETVAEMQGVALGGLLAFVQGISRRQLRARLYLVTRGACAVMPDDMVDPLQAPLWGLGRVMSLELPNVWGGIVDLGQTREGESDPAEGLLAACLAPDHEDQVALRKGRRHVPRINRLDSSTTTVSPRLAEEATYLVTGGVGALGLTTAQWLVEQGAGTIVLVSRRLPDEAAQKAIDELRSRCQVYVRSTDVGRIEEVRALLAYIANELPPIRGIVHAAGLTSTRSMTELSTDELTNVLAPKVQGTWWLHELTQDADLDFFVGFSSVVSVLGNPGQAYYAAANAFMDAVMWHRQAHGLVGTSLNFGPWSGRGMGSEQERRWLELSGINPLAPDKALAGFGRLQHKAQAIVADLDWSKLPKTTFEGHSRALLEELALFDQDLIKTGKTSLTEQLEQAPATARRSILEEEVRRLIAQVLRTEPEQVDTQLGFFDLGMDSVMAMEFRLLLERALGRALPSTLAMDHPRVGEVTNYVLTEVLAFEPANKLKPARNDTRDQDSAVAVIGLACRVPGAADLRSFWRLLEAGMEAIGEIPAGRWDMSDYYDPDPEAVGKIYTRFAGLIENVDKFDASLFGIAPREAVSMDPQQRLLLEISWEALEHANISPAAVGRTRTGVYVGAGANEYGNLVLASDAGAIDAHFSTGNALSTIAGRLAFALGLEGPAMVIDTACSSSLVAAHQACQALRGRECDLALAAGVNLLLSPEGMIATCRARMLAPDGRCKTFDSAADGYVRGEGGGVVVLKRLNDARRDGDRILAVIRGSAVNQDGRSSGLTVPNGPSQERVISAALERAGVKPAEVTYLEAHGTGTNLGDPIEVQAAAAALGKGRTAERPLLIGSVKTNIGHLEAAAGIAGLIKVILAIEHGRIPKQLHFRTPNPHIPWERLAVAVTKETREWPEGKKIAGVSSFGFSGTNAHVVIEEPPAESRSEPGLAGERSHHVLVLSARSQSALRQLAGRYGQWLERHPEARLGDVAYTAGVGRAHLEERAALIIESRERAGQLLTSLEQGRAAEGLFSQAVKKEPKVAWFFTGQGSQYVGMGQELYQSQEVVREVIDRCDRALRGQREHGLVKVLFKEEALLNHTSYTQPALYALEVAMAELWKSWGVEPDVVLGHSVGQYAAAVVAGVMSLEEGLGLIAKRAELMGRLPTEGAIEPVLDEFESYGQTIRFQPAQRRLVCNLTGGLLPAEQVLEASYWRRHIREAVQFAHSVRTVAELGIGVVMEMGPRPVLLGMVPDCWPAEIKPAVLVATLRPEQNDNCQMAHAFAQCYVHGLSLDFSAWDRSWHRRKLDLPTYPFQQTRYWIEKRGSQVLSAPLSGVRQNLSSGEIVQQNDLSARYQPWLADHRIHETVIAPGSLYFTTALASEPALSRLSQVIISQPLSFTNWAEMADSSRLVELSIKPPTDGAIGRRFEIHSQTVKAGEKRWTLHAHGTLEISKGNPDHRLVESLAQLQQRLGEGSVGDFYDAYAAIGLQFGPCFQGLTSLWLGTGEALGEIQRPTGLKDGNNPIHPAMLDACFQVLGAARGPISDQIYVPFTCEVLEIWETVPEHFYCYAHLREKSAPDAVTGDLWLVDEEDRVLGNIVGLVIKRLSKGLLDDADQEIDNWFYDVEWQERAVVSSERAKGDNRHDERNGSGKWLIIGDRGGIGEQVAERLRLLGQPPVVFELSGNNVDGLLVPPGFSALDPAAWEQLLGSSFEDGQPLSGVLHLSSLDSPDNDGTTADTLSQDVRNNCASALALVQALVRREITLSAGLWLVTQGSQSVVGEGTRSLAQSPLWGFGKVVALEHPELACRRVDLDSPISSEQLDALVQALLHPEAEDQIAWRQGKCWVARLRSSSEPAEDLRLPAQHFSLHKSTDGTIEGLRFEPVHVSPPGKGEVQIEVKAVGLNFRDVLNALGMYPGEAGPLGSDLAGRVVAIGPEVATLSIGDEVVGFGDGTFADRINVPANRLVHKPGIITFAEAATLPSAFATTELAFQNAALRAGDRVLIHAAAGGVGLAAIQLAKQIGAQIFATASGSKQSYLRSLGVEHIYDSRTPLFGRQILTDTAGGGVDVVLNSLTGKGFIEASLDALKPGGRFVELAKREIWTAEQMARTRPDVRFEVLALDQAIAESPDRVRSLFYGLIQRVDRRELRPLPVTRYGFAQARSAFRYMQQARHIGKIVLEKAPLGALRLGGEGAYLITGGLGGLGLKVARWLVENGARFLVLNGRHAADSKAQQLIEELRETGARIEVVLGNVAQKEEVERILQHFDGLGWQLKGIFHSAGVIRDGALLNQNWQRFEEVLAPKVLGSWHLHRLTLDYPLDLFVLFSSAASLVGNHGQSNYAAANMFLDMLAHSRRASGLPAISINWGPWSEVGTAAERQSDLRSRSTLSGLSWISPSSGLKALQRILTGRHAQIGVMPIKWHLFRQDESRDPFLAEVKGETAAAPRFQLPSVQSGINRRLKRAPIEERLPLLTDYLQQELVRALQLPNPPAIDAGFQNLGTDSLMAVEIRNRLNKELQLDPALSATALFEFPNVESLAKEIARILGEREPVPANASQKPPIVITPVETDAVAVVGLSCRFPQGLDPDDFWELLISGSDAIRRIPGDRWDVEAFYDPDPNAPGKMYTLDGGFLEQVDKFDGNFFEISPREAISLDPQHRMLLELSWEALEYGGIDPKGLKGSQTGVYMGLSSGDYADLLKSAGPDIIDAQLSTGTAHSTAVGRISYFFGLHGPSLAIDTACSSSLVAVHQACRDLLSNECSLALAGGVNAILRPETIIDFCKARMLSADGRCKTFDSGADGYARGEGGGVVVLKRLNDARRDGDRILAVIRGSAVNQDGRSSGLTAPNGKAQERVISAALERAGVKPAEVTYLEAHGTGTNLGDPIEVQAAAAALGKGRTAERPLLIGSVKTNIGHLEAAAGIAGLIKVILAIEHGRIPKQLHFRTPNPHIPWERLAVAVTKETREWPEGKKIAGVSSFGFSGTNAHVVIEEPPAESRSEPGLAGERSHHVLVLSARSQSALRQLAGRYGQWLERHPEARLGDVAYTAGVGRAHLEERAALIIESRERAGQLLTSLEQGRAAEGLFSQAVKKEPKVAWFFTGQGSQYVGMGQELYQSQEVVREVIDRCDRALRGQREHGLVKVLFKEEALLNHTSYTQPALYALEVAMAELWKSWGVEPDVVLGHSVGQYAAAVVAGVMSLEEGLGLIAKRAELMGRLPTEGAMAAVFASQEMVEQVLERNAELSVAGFNGAHQVLSGPETALQPVLAELTRQGVRSLRLNTSHAFHSALMDPVLDEFESYGQTIRFQPAQRRLVCNLTGGLLPAEQVLEASYWRRHIREPVQFAWSVQTVARLGVDVVMEMGPRPVLLGMAPHCWPAEINSAALVTTLRPDQSDNCQMAHAFAQCYVHGLSVNFAAWDRCWPRRKLELPTYPFQRTRYWIESKTRSVGARPESHHAPNGQTNERHHAPTNSSKFPETINRASEPNDTLDLLRSTIADVLRCRPEEIDPDRELSQYGFGSLYIVRAVEQFEATTGFRFSPRAFFENRTLREVVKNGMKEASVSATTGINRSSGRTIFFDKISPGQTQLQHESGSFPLSEGQKVLWSIQQSNPDSTAYHVPIAIYWDEPIDRVILGHVLQQLTIEQPALRASFPFEITGPVQRIKESIPVPIHYENLIGLLEAERAERIRRVNEQPFDLERGPLWRLYVFSISDQRSILMLNFHHLIADGHSTGFLLEELERRYRSIRNRTQELTRIAQNGIEDWTAIEKRYLAGDSFQQDRAHWLNLFPNGFPLPFTIAGPQGAQTRQGREGEVLQMSVPESVIRSLEKLASRENVTLQAVFLAAVHALLAAATRRLDPVVAVATDIRPPGFEEVVGFFVNMLPIPATLNVSASFHELAQQVFGRLLGALEHRRFPLRQLVQDLAQAGKNWNELQAAFYFQAAESPEQRRFADRLVPDVHQTGEFDLVFEVIEASRDWHLNVKYRPRMFGRATIEQLAARYGQLLAAISMSPDRPLVELTPAHALASSASLNFEFPERCVHHLIEDRAARTPNEKAVLFQGQHLTYVELDQKANQLARYLIRSGVSRGALVGVMLNRSMELLVGLLATWKAGAAYVPLDPGHPSDRLQGILRDARVRVLLTETACPLRPADLRAIEIDREQAAIQRELNTNPITDSSPDDLAYVIYTSGSTGEPKGVQIAHRSLAHFLWCMAERPGCTAEDYVVASTTICFDIAALELFLPLVTGARLEILPEEIVRNGLRLKQMLENSPATLVQATPATWKMLLAAELGRLPRVKALCGGEAWDTDLGDQLLARTRELWNMYGPTETTIWSSIQKIEAGEPVRLGDPIGNTQFYVFDEAMRPVRPGEIGELFIGGDGLAKGYLNRPALTQERFVLHPTRPKEIIYRTGDLVRYV